MLPDGEKPTHSPAFGKAFDQVKQVVSDYMDGRKSRSFTLALLCPQSVNHNSKPDGKGGRYLTAEHKQFRHEVAIACYANKVPKLYGTLDVRIEINNPRADACDNFTKPILDALQRAGAIDNDRNVHHLEVTRSDSIPSGSFVITVREI